MNHESETWIEEVESVANAIRRRVLRHTVSQNGGYLSQACSSAELLATLYLRVMNLGLSQGPPIPPPFSGPPAPGHLHQSGGLYNGPRHPDLDRFFFSPVHYALVLYSTLIETGRMADALDQFNQDGSTVEMIGAEHSPGIETTGGSLSQTLSQAIGVLLARRLKKEQGRVWVFMSDGEFQEGQTWEAFAAASFHSLGNLGVIVDCNGQQCDGPMDSVMNIEPLGKRLSSFGASVVSIDGHSVSAIAEATSKIQTDRPLVVLGLTDACRGLDILRSRAKKLHYVRFKGEAERARYHQVLDEWEEDQ